MLKGKLIGFGRTAEVYEWDKDCIVKLFYEGIPLAQVQYEYEMAVKVQTQIQHTPKAYELVEIENRYGIVFEKLVGVSLMRQIEKRPWDMGRWGRALGEIHYALHQTCEVQMRHSQEEITKNILASDLLEESTKTKVITVLQKLPEGQCLLHGDFHPDNVMFSGENYYVIDWITSTIGNPLGDVARTSILISFGIVPGKSKFENFILSLGRRKLNQAYVKRYMELSGATIEEIEEWILPMAAARLVEGIPREEKDYIVQEIHRRLKKNYGNGSLNT